MGVKWVQGRLVHGCECCSPLEVMKPSEEIDIAVVTYCPSFILLVHPVACSAINNNDEVLTNVDWHQCIAIHDLFTKMTIAHPEAQ